MAACFVEREGRFLILHRNPGGRHGGKWGLPAGRVEPGETEKEAVTREVKEETGISIPMKKLEFLKAITFDFPEKTIEFFVHRASLESDVEVVLDRSENQSYAWVTGEECYERNDLIDGVRVTLEETGYAPPDAFSRNRL